jgi:hypothetical protein
MTFLQWCFAIFCGLGLFSLTLWWISEEAKIDEFNNQNFQDFDHSDHKFPKP